MENEKIMDVEIIENAGNGKTMKVIAGVGLAGVAGVVAYKFVVKPIMQKFKDKKEAEENNDNVVELEEN